MKKLLLTSIAALFLATGTAHAEVKTDIDGYPKPVRTWIAHIHSCSIYRPARVANGNDEPATDVISWDEIPKVLRALRERTVSGAFADMSNDQIVLQGG